MVSDSAAEVFAARERALAELRAAHRAVEVWVGLVRGAAEQRVGSAEPDAVVRDPSFVEALNLWMALGTVYRDFAASAAAIEAGEA